ncbi:hypothetical protein GUITHDRAFT_111525 [Guillardia theta CCMP2712]|uniref:Uncharacterized protein n=1 Tax=Guillardia theta (strain CCMP2712) TaxID=905079 RepID=L1J203_GUITC|nr:hypothetical protein GUITHDRAFT_111525 [Guillardia theta CCMP2712]EKX42551.1 hypothetical protein GUITHDRAFT_111525 [Guillardia theta CCMP2712]|eukprot:XP_005829531.1 hypothetical protein GUITHDRAFT_111525 [Guillardia theta CCMP2712]
MLLAPQDELNSYSSNAITSEPVKCMRGTCAVLGMCMCGMKDRAKPTMPLKMQNSFRKLSVESAHPPELPAAPAVSARGANKSVEKAKSVQTETRDSKPAEVAASRPMEIAASKPMEVPTSRPVEAASPKPASPPETKPDFSMFDFSI